MTPNFVPYVTGNTLAKASNETVLGKTAKHVGF